jgi:alpha-N-arabinofuranosidase
MDRFIKSVSATIDYVKSLKRSTKTVNLSFDEWNVWYQQKQIRFDWEIAPPILEDQYSLLDALVFAAWA